MALVAWRVIDAQAKMASAGPGTTRLAAAANGRTILAVDEAGHRILSLNADTLARTVFARFAKAEEPRGVVVGQRTGRVYVAYNTLSAQAGKRSAHLSVFNRNGQRLADTRLRKANRSWLVYAMAISADESRAYVSYHGSDTTGLDSIEVSAGRLRACSAGSAVAACWGKPHGGVATTARGVLTATGRSQSLYRTLTGERFR